MTPPVDPSQFLSIVFGFVAFALLWAALRSP